VPAVRFRVTCLGASLAAARATRSSLDAWLSMKPARTAQDHPCTRYNTVCANPLTLRRFLPQTRIS
jgi:hypothetical protein